MDAVRLRGAFRSNGFAINPQKVHYADKHSRRTVTGLKINELVNVDRKFVRNIRAALFVVENQGAAVAQKALKDKYGREASIASSRTDILGMLDGVAIKTAGFMIHVMAWADTAVTDLARSKISII